MKTNAITTFLALLSATMAAPAPQASTATITTAPVTTAPITPSRHGPFTLTAINHNNLNIQFASVTARDTRFWIGKTTHAGCPGGPYPCDIYGNKTTLQTQDPPARLSMFGSVPGGQFVYIGPKGALRFTEPHHESDTLPAGSTLGPFTVEKGENGGLLQLYGPGAFMACTEKKANGEPKESDGKVFYQVYVDTNGFSKEGCVEFDILAVNGTAAGAAFEYL